MLVGYAGLVARAVQLQAIDAGWLAARAHAQHRSTVQLGAIRGEVVDRKGELLAISADVRSVAASPRQISTPRRTAARLARALDLQTADVARRLSGERSFVWIKRWVSPDEAERVRALDLEGVDLVVERRRMYPHADLAASYLGFAGRDEVGLSGLELAFDAALRGNASALPALRDAAGRKLVAWGASSEPRDGARLVLALDAGVQYAAERALDAGMERTGAQTGTIVALDPRNGDVLAIAERPGFDPNRFWLETPRRFRTRSFTDAFEPGSTLKPFVFALAFEHDLFKGDEPIDCEGGAWRVADRVIHDWRPHGVLPLRDVLVNSSNIGSAKVAEALGTERLVPGLRKFGFGSRTESGFPGEAPGVVLDLRPTQQVERATLAFGQGMTTTAVQLATAGAALANGGRRVVPRLALRMEEPEGRLDWPVKEGEQIVDARVARKVLGILHEVVDRGTGRAARLEAVAVAGKTGTAQKVVDGGYAQDRFVASFLGYLPAQNPRMVVVVVLDEPHEPHTGGGAAAPVFRDVAAYAARQIWLARGGSG
jgi:cell division protein FtsI (penicillin-binding protein 3)